MDRYHLFASDEIAAVDTERHRSTVRGIYMDCRQVHERTLVFITQHNLSLVIDKTFAFENSLEAYRNFAA